MTRPPASLAPATRAPNTVRAIATDQFGDEYTLWLSHRPTAGSSVPIEGIDVPVVASTRSRVQANVVYLLVEI